MVYLTEEEWEQRNGLLITSGTTIVNSTDLAVLIADASAMINEELGCTSDVTDAGLLNKCKVYTNNLVFRMIIRNRQLKENNYTDMNTTQIMVELTPSEKADLQSYRHDEQSRSDTARTRIYSMKNGRLVH
jgi:hypothetical protein